MLIHILALKPADFRLSLTLRHNIIILCNGLRNKRASAGRKTTETLSIHVLALNHQILGFYLTEKTLSFCVLVRLKNKEASTGRKASETLPIHFLALKPAGVRLPRNRKTVSTSTG